jgi:hypothetical protein
VNASVPPPNTSLSTVEGVVNQLVAAEPTGFFVYARDENGTAVAPTTGDSVAAQLFEIRHLGSSSWSNMPNITGVPSTVPPADDACSGLDILERRLVECGDECVPREACTEAYKFSYAVLTAGYYFLRVFLAGFPLLDVPDGQQVLTPVIVVASSFSAENSYVIYRSDVDPAYDCALTPTATTARCERNHMPAGSVRFFIIAVDAYDNPVAETLNFTAQLYQTVPDHRWHVPEPMLLR